MVAANKNNKNPFAKTEDDKKDDAPVKKDSKAKISKETSL